MRIEGLDKYKRSMGELMVKAKRGGDSVVIGYTQAYALKVHEDLEAHHRPGKQAKYLEEPARTQSTQIAQVIRATYKRTRDRVASLLAGALYLLRASQAIVPVDTGALRASGFVAVESEAETEALRAYLRSEGVKATHQ